MLNHIEWLWRSQLNPDQLPLFERLMSDELPAEREEGAPDWWVDDIDAASTNTRAARALGYA